MSLDKAFSRGKSMKRMGTSTLTAAAALLAGVMMTSAAGAAPASSLQAVGSQVNGQDATVQTIRDGRGRHGRWHGRHHRHNGWGWGGAAAAGLLLTAPLWAGGTYAYDEPYDGYDGGYDDGAYAYSGGGVARCEATFRSFDPATGTYMGYDGVRRACPYL
jgi:BA14K-like protein